MKALLFALFVLDCFCIGYFLAAVIDKRRKPKTVTVRSEQFVGTKNRHHAAPDTINPDLDFTKFESKK